MNFAADKRVLLIVSAYVFVLVHIISSHSDVLYLAFLSDDVILACVKSCVCEVTLKRC